jgi:plasmid stabilization system protein ParE
MTYRIEIMPPALRELDDAFNWIARRSPKRAETWQARAMRAIQSLVEFPRRCPLAPENEDFGVEVRQLLYGDYRIVFTIEDDTVRILHVRHGARSPIAPDEL